MRRELPTRETAQSPATLTMQPEQDEGVSEELAPREARGRRWTMPFAGVAETAVTCTELRDAEVVGHMAYGPRRREQHRGGVPLRRRRA